jgi:hypothetical protein
MKIYITYCSAQKNDALKDTGIEVMPDVLYTSKNRIQPFMQTCKRQGVRWAIFSDLYGIWLPEEKHAWYEKSPDNVSEAEFKELLANFDTRLAGYTEICFYRPSPIYFHSLYRRLLKETRLNDRIRIISSIYEIE